MLIASTCVRLKRFRKLWGCCKILSRSSALNIWYFCALHGKPVIFGMMSPSWQGTNIGYKYFCSEGDTYHIGYFLVDTLLLTSDFTFSKFLHFQEKPNAVLNCPYNLAKPNIRLGTCPRGNIRSRTMFTSPNSLGDINLQPSLPSSSNSLSIKTSCQSRLLGSALLLNRTPAGTRLPTLFWLALYPVEFPCWWIGRRNADSCVGRYHFNVVSLPLYEILMHGRGDTTLCVNPIASKV